MKFGNFTLTFFLMLVGLILSTDKSFGQNGKNGINFQAVARDNFKNPLKNTRIYVMSSVIQGTIGGTAVLVEQHPVTTNSEGVFNISVGQGNPMTTPVSLEAIDWANGPFYLNLKISKSNTPPANMNSNDWLDLGSSIFGTVPYAIYAGNVSNKINIADSNLYVTPAQLAAKTATVSSFSVVSSTLNTKVNNKLNISDTANMLRSYVTQVDLADKLSQISLTPGPQGIQGVPGQNGTVSALTIPMELGGGVFDGKAPITLTLQNASIASNKLVGTDISVVGTILSGVWNGSEIAITRGGTGASDAPTARFNLGLGNVENTNDLDKPISTATKAALDLKVNLSDLGLVKDTIKNNLVNIDAAIASTNESITNNRLLTETAIGNLSAIVVNNKQFTDSALGMKVNTVDTANMLSAYALKGITTSNLALKLNISDTVALGKRVIDQLSDTATLINSRITALGNTASDAISAEVSRATLAEGVLTSNLSVTNTMVAANAQTAADATKAVADNLVITNNTLSSLTNTVANNAHNAADATKEVAHNLAITNSTVATNAQTAADATKAVADNLAITNSTVSTLSTTVDANAKTASDATKAVADNLAITNSTVATNAQTASDATKAVADNLAITNSTVSTLSTTVDANAKTASDATKAVADNLAITNSTVATNAQTAADATKAVADNLAITNSTVSTLSTTVDANAKTASDATKAVADNLVITNNTVSTLTNTVATNLINTNAAISTKQNALTITTNGNSGAASLNGSVLNIPQYSSGLTTNMLTFGTGLVAGSFNGSVATNIKVDTIAIASVGKLNKFKDSLLNASIISHGNGQASYIIPPTSTVTAGNPTANSISTLFQYSYANNLTIVLPSPTNYAGKVLIVKYKNTSNRRRNMTITGAIDGSLNNSVTVAVNSTTNVGALHLGNFIAESDGKYWWVTSFFAY